MNLDEILKQLTEIVVEYGPKLIGAIVVWILGSWTIKVMVRKLDTIFNKRKVDVSLKPFLRSLISLY